MANITAPLISGLFWIWSGLFRPVPPAGRVPAVA